MCVDEMTVHPKCHQFTVDSISIHTLKIDAVKQKFIRLKNKSQKQQKSVKKHLKNRDARQIIS